MQPRGRLHASKIDCRAARRQAHTVVWRRRTHAPRHPLGGRVNQNRPQRRRCDATPTATERRRRESDERATRRDGDEISLSLSLFLSHLHKVLEVAGRREDGRALAEARRAGAHPPDRRGRHELGRRPRFAERRVERGRHGAEHGLGRLRAVDAREHAVAERACGGGERRSRGATRQGEPRRRVSRRDGQELIATSAVGCEAPPALSRRAHRRRRKLKRAHERTRVERKKARETRTRTLACLRTRDGVAVLVERRDAHADLLLRVVRALLEPSEQRGVVGGWRLECEVVDLACVAVRCARDKATV